MTHPWTSLRAEYFGKVTQEDNRVMNDGGTSDFARNSHCQDVVPWYRLPLRWFNVIRLMMSSDCGL